MIVRRARASEGRPLLVAESNPSSCWAEAYRTLRTNIQFAVVDRPCRSILITSSTPRAGKTTAVANFGIVTAQAGSKVCLVDSDLRRPVLHHVFGLDQRLGLTSALLDELPLAAVAQPTRIPNLSVVTSGAVPLNPSELLGSKRMRDLLKVATSSFDLIVLDSPPLMSVSDGVALAAICDGVMLVVRAGLISRELVQRTVAHLKTVQGRMLGVLLNDVDLGDEHYYHAYYPEYQSDADGQ